MSQNSSKMTGPHSHCIPDGTNFETELRALYTMFVYNYRTMFNTGRHAEEKMLEEEMKETISDYSRLHPENDKLGCIRATPFYQLYLG